MTSRHLGLLAVMLGLAACATGDRRGFEAFERVRPNIFISPHGQPFRAPRGAPRPLAVWFVQADADRDGRLTLTEFRADADAFFGTLDADDDEVIDGFEIVAYETRVAPEILPDYGAEAPAPGPAGEPASGPILLDGRRDRGFDPRLPGGGGVNVGGAASYGLLADAQPVAAANYDQSRSVSRAEFRRAADERFGQLDATRTGALTLAELESRPRPRLSDRLRRTRD